MAAPVDTGVISLSMEIWRAIARFAILRTALVSENTLLSVAEISDFSVGVRPGRRNTRVHVLSIHGGGICGMNMRGLSGVDARGGYPPLA